MATINGIGIKAVKTFRGHEGELLCQGQIYIDGKKGGLWSQDFMSGPDAFEGDSWKAVDEAARKLKEGYPKTNRYYSVQDSPEVFMHYLVTLLDHEKAFRKNRKKGYTRLVIAENGRERKWTAYVPPKGASETDIRNTDNAYGRQMADEMIPKNAPVSITVYTDESDFNITVDKDHPAPEWMCV